jgi:hypothetical protein
MDKSVAMILSKTISSCDYSFQSTSVLLEYVKQDSEKFLKSALVHMHTLPNGIVASIKAKELHYKTLCAEVDDLKIHRFDTSLFMKHYEAPITPLETY